MYYRWTEKAVNADIRIALNEPVMKWIRISYSKATDTEGFFGYHKQGFIEIKHEPTKNPKQRRQQSIASVMRSATCIQAQLTFIQNELSKIDLSDLDDNEATRVAKVYDNISRSKVVRTKEEANKLVESLKLLNKYVTLANKESRTPLTR